MLLLLATCRALMWVLWHGKLGSRAMGIVGSWEAWCTGDG